MQKLIFTTLATPGKSELDALLMVKSIRTFGRDLAENPIWVLVPKKLGPLSEQVQDILSHLNASIFSFDVTPEIQNFPFATKIVAAAFAEAQSQLQTERLIFMDGDTLVLQEPTEFLITDNKTLGYRPVHHKLIGSAWDEEPDHFWKLIYEICDVPDENIFPMTTHAGEQIRPYFNAGMFIIRPERGLLTLWEKAFLKWYRQPEFRSYYEKDQRYAIFVHQVIFTGVLLQNLKPGEIHELNPKINYPLHLHRDIPTNQRPEAINELITVRYEGIFDQPGWQQLPIMEPLKSWLETQLKLQKSLGVTI